MRKLRALRPLLVAFGLLGALAGGYRARTAMGEHERLRVQNTFKSPEEVIQYYCGRDASGFVWSGLLDSERRAFTTWKEAPEHENFFVARRYEIRTLEQNASTASVEVRYLVVGMGDANGAFVPSADPEKRVRFTLNRIDGKWKIVSPKPSEISPVVLETKFPFVAQN